MTLIQRNVEQLRREGIKNNQKKRNFEKRVHYFKNVYFQKCLKH